MFAKEAYTLMEGDVIDLIPALVKYDGGTEEDYDHDISAFEYAIVERVEWLDAGPDYNPVMLYTDQHNLVVDASYLFELEERAQLDTSEQDRAQDAANSILVGEYFNTNVGGN